MRQFIRLAVYLKSPRLLGVALWSLPILFVFPSIIDAQPTTIIVPLYLDTNSDLISRTIAGKMDQVVIVNKPGEEGLLGLNALLTTPPNGKTYMMLDNNLVLSAIAKNKAGLLQAVQGVSMIGIIGLSIAVPDRSNVTDFQQLITYAKGRNLTFGTAGPNTASDICARQFIRILGIQGQLIRFQGEAALINALLNGHIEVGLTTNAPAYMRPGMMRVLASTLPFRSYALPNVPTLGELGFPAVTPGIWYALVARKEVERRAMSPFISGLKSALTNGEVRQQFEKRGSNMDLTHAEDVDPDIADWFLRNEIKNLATFGSQ